MESTNLDATAFLNDLLDCVCILQRDGLDIVYSHRSFQEYFSAYCLARLPEERVADLIQKFAWRSTDTVLSMLFDMNKDLVIRAYLYPSLDKYFRKTSALTEDSSTLEHIDALGCGFTVRYIEYTGRTNTILLHLTPAEQEMVALRSVIMHIYKSKRPTADYRIDASLYHPRTDYASFRDAILPFTRKYKMGVYFSINFNNGQANIYFHGSKFTRNVLISDEEIEILIKWLSSTRLKAIFWQEHLFVISVYKTMKMDQSRKSKTLDEILGIKN